MNPKERKLNPQVDIAWVCTDYQRRKTTREKRHITYKNKLLMIKLTKHLTPIHIPSQELKKNSRKQENSISKSGVKITVN